MMKQLTIPTILQEQESFTSAFWQVYIDGASRNNPGPSGAGICLKRNQEIVAEYGFYVGKKTNNQAEYFALLFGLMLVLPELQEEDKLEIVSDSELLVRQIKGIYKVKNPDLQKMHQVAKKMLEGSSYTIRHVLRSDNQDADRLANVAVDKKIAPPLVYVEQLRSYGITI